MADNVKQDLDRLYTGLVYVHYGLLQFYKQLDIGNAQQRKEARVNLFRNIQELGRLINSLKPIMSKSASIKKAEGGLSEAVQQVSNSISELNNWALMMEANNDDKKSMIERIHQLGREFNNLQRYLNIGKAASLEEIIEFADYLDEIGAYSLADVVTNSVFVLVKKAYIPKLRNEVGEPELPIQPLREGSLSTRYCPDHRGVQAIRVAERTYQCPIDGKVYNYETGYVNYQGQQVPGGSIAEQTPMTSNYGGIPMRIYDSRQSVLNRIN